MLAILPLGGCSTSGLNDPNADWLTTGSTGTPLLSKDGDLLTPPGSDHALTKGDNSARILALGKENFINQNFGLSERYFRKAVELRTDSASAWAGLAASYDELGRFDLADRAYDQLVKIKGNDPRVLNNRGYSFLLRGDYKKARSYFQRAQSADMTIEHVHGNLSLLEKITSS